MPISRTPCWSERSRRLASRTIRWVEADALNLPFAAGQFDLVTSAFGFRNLANYDRGLAEIYRVLAPMVKLAFSISASPRG